MSKGLKTVFIANPASGNGRVGRDWTKISRRIQENYTSPYILEMSRYPGHVTELSRQAVEAGYQLVVAIGGDGTINEALNGLFQGSGPLKEEAVLGLLPMGTGNDLGRSLGAPKDLSQAVRALSGAEVSLLDVAKVTASTANDQPYERYFLNVADFGAGGVIAERVNRTTKAFGRQLSYWWGVVATMVSFKNASITFSIDGREERKAILNDFILANGRYFGGGLKPAPHARMDDGQFDLVTLGDIGLVESLVNFPRLKRGSHLTHKKVGFFRGRVVKARSDTRVLVEADGEVVGSLPATFEILPRALQVKTNLCQNPE